MGEGRRIENREFPDMIFPKKLKLTGFSGRTLLADSYKAIFRIIIAPAMGYTTTGLSGGLVIKSRYHCVFGRFGILQQSLVGVTKRERIFGVPD